MLVARPREALTLQGRGPPPELARLAGGGEFERTWPEGLTVDEDRKKATWCPKPGHCAPVDLGESTIGQADVNGDFLVVAPEADLGTEGKPMQAFVINGLGQRVATIPLTDEELTSGCPGVSWAGQSIWVTMSVCAGPGAVGWLADPMTGKRRAWLGGADREAAWGAYGAHPVMIGDEIAAFREQYGQWVVFHDTRTGAVVRKTDLRPSHGKDPETGDWYLGDAEEGTMVPVGDTLVVTQGGDHRDTIVLVDTKTGAVTGHLKLTACAP